MGIRLVCAGSCGVDYYEDERSRFTGGSTLNTAGNLHELLKSEKSKTISSVSVVTAVGNDWDGHEILDEIREKWPKSPVSLLTGTCPVQNIKITAAGESVVSSFTPGVLAEWHLTEHQKQSLREADLVLVPLFTGFEQIFYGISQVVSPDRLVVQFSNLRDLNLQDPPVRTALEEMAVGFFSLQADDERQVEFVLALSEIGKGVFVVLLSKLESLFIQGGAIHHSCPAVPVHGMVSPTGASDAFAAAFMTSWVRYGAPEFALQQASEHTAKVVSGSLKIARFLGK